MVSTVSLEYKLGLFYLFSYLVFLGLAFFLLSKGLFPLISIVTDTVLVLNKLFLNGLIKYNDNPFL